MKSGGYGTGLVGAVVGTLLALLAFFIGFSAQQVLHAGAETGVHANPH